MTLGRILENRGAAATLLELAEQRRNCEKPGDVGATAGFGLILSSQPSGVCRQPLAVALPNAIGARASWSETDDAEATAQH